jgi:preprotein translocase subunit SecE
VAAEPVRFLREVRSEVAKVTWPTRRETMVLTAQVIAMVAIAAAFLFLVDWIMALGVHRLFGIGV